MRPSTATGWPARSRTRPRPPPPRRYRWPPAARRPAGDPPRRRSRTRRWPARTRTPPRRRNHPPGRPPGQSGWRRRAAAAAPAGAPDPLCHPPSTGQRPSEYRRAPANHRSPTRQIACSEGKFGSASHVYVRSSGAGNAAAARCRSVVSPPDPGQHQTRRGTCRALLPVDPDASWPAARAAALDDLTRLTALTGVVLVGPPTFTCCEPPGWSGPLGTPGDLLLVAVAAVRAAAADERTPAPTGSPSAQYLPADVTVRERGVGERAARLEALTRLLRTGLTTEAIAVRTGLSTRTLDRLRVAVDNPSP